MMALGHDLPQESAHLRRVGSSLFVYMATAVELSVATNTVWFGHWSLKL